MACTSEFWEALSGAGDLLWLGVGSIALGILAAVFVLFVGTVAYVLFRERLPKRNTVLRVGVAITSLVTAFYASVLCLGFH